MRTGILRANRCARASLVVTTLSIAMVLSTAVGAADIVPSDIQTALELGQCKTAGDAINRGLERSEAEAYYYAGLLYDVTVCVEEDAARAARYYRQAAQRGDLRGADALGFAYGRGRGVAQDYVAAYEWFVVRQRRGAAAVAVDPSFARSSGYAMTVARLARDQARYPDGARLGDTRATLEALFDVTTGKVAIRLAKADISIGSNVARSSVFVDAVTVAYGEAVALAPSPGPLPAIPSVYVTPWRFGVIRDDQDRPVPVTGAVSIGSTEPLVPQ